MLDVGPILEDATDGIGDEGEEQVLNGQRGVVDDREVIGEVVRDVSCTINEEHPLELERAEEFNRPAEQLFESSPHALFDALLAIRVLDH